MVRMDVLILIFIFLNLLMIVVSKNYNLKFGKKVENIQMYNNVEDMIEGRFF